MNLTAVIGRFDFYSSPLPVGAFPRVMANCKSPCGAFMRQRTDLDQRHRARLVGISTWHGCASMAWNPKKYLSRLSCVLVDLSVPFSGMSRQSSTHVVHST